MAKEVIKKDQSKEKFQVEKIKSSIRKAAEDAGVNNVDKLVEVISKVAIDFSKEYKVIETKAIRDKITEALDKIMPEVAAAWREYEEKK